MPWRVSAGTISARVHSFLAQVRRPPEAQKPGVQLRASSQRSKGAASRMGSSHPPCLFSPASGQVGSSGAGADLGWTNAIDAPWGATALADACVGRSGMGV